MTLILCYTLVWHSVYFWENLPEPFNEGVFLLLLLIWAIMILISLFQLYKFIVEQPKDYFRLLNIGLIVLVSWLYFWNPRGVIDFTKYEKENILTAHYRATSIRLKVGNRFEERISRIGYYNRNWGDYAIVGDTVKLHYDNVSSANTKLDYAIMDIDKGAIKKCFGRLDYYYIGQRHGLPMCIIEVNKEKMELTSRDSLSSPQPPPQPRH